MNWFELLTSHLAGPLGYAGVLLLLMACGLGVPVPEDIILISGGYIASTAGDKPYPMMVVGLIGILVGDSIIYWLGRSLGMPIAQRTPLREVLTPDRLSRVKRLFKKYGQIILMAARFMPGVRAVTFFSAGTMRVHYYKFLAFDGSAALISAPLWVFLGYRFSSSITQVLEKAHHAQHWILAGIAGIIAFLWVRRLLGHRRAPPADQKTPPESNDSNQPMLATGSASDEDAKVGRALGG